MSERPGTATNDDASPGNVGESWLVKLRPAQAVPLTTDVTSTVISQAVPGGDYFAQFTAAYHSPNGNTVPIYVKQGVSVLPATLGDPGNLGGWSSDYLEVAIPEDPAYVSPIVRLTFDARGGTIYANAESEFGSGLLLVYGALLIWRKR